MKKILFSCLFTLAISSSFSQTIETEKNGKVVIKNNNDSIIAQIENPGSGAFDAIFNADKTQIALIYANGNVIVKKNDGTLITQIAEAGPDKAASISWTGDLITITTLSGKKIVKKSLEWQ